MKTCIMFLGKALIATDTIREKIQTAASNCGAETLDTLLEIALNISIHDIKTDKTPEFNKLIDFFNRMYVPMSYKIYPKKTTAEGLVLLK